MKPRSFIRIFVGLDQKGRYLSYDEIGTRVESILLCWVQASLGRELLNFLWLKCCFSLQKRNKNNLQSKWRYRSSLECQRRKDEVKGLQLGSPKLLTINNSLQKCVSLFLKKHTCSMGSLFVTIVNHCHVLFQVTSLDAWKLAHCFSSSLS